eukprot:245691-Prymnesium_polylepis.1
MPARPFPVHSFTRLGAQCAPVEPARRRCVDDLTFAAQDGVRIQYPLPLHATHLMLVWPIRTGLTPD